MHYQVPTNGGPGVHLHGGDKGLSRRVWRVTGQNANSASFAITSPDGEEGYPGKLDATCTYRIDAPDELLGEDFRRRIGRECLARHGVHHGQHILYAMIELFDQRALMRFGFSHRLLMLLAAAKRLFGAQLFRADAEVFLLETMPELGFARDLGLFEIEIDEHLDLRPQDERIDRFEHHVDRTRRIGLQQMRVVAIERGQEHDRNVRRSLARADIACDFIAIHIGHVHVQQDDGKILVQ